MIDNHPLTDIGFKVLCNVHDRLAGKFDPPGHNTLFKDMLKNMKLIYRIKKERYGNNINSRS